MLHFRPRLGDPRGFLAAAAGAPLAGLARPGGRTPHGPHFGFPPAPLSQVGGDVVTSIGDVAQQGAEDAHLSETFCAFFSDTPADAIEAIYGSLCVQNAHSRPQILDVLRVRAGR